MSEAVSIIIPNYNGEGVIIHCLKSLEDAASNIDVSQMDIIVVDDCSRDKSIELIKKHFPSVRLFCTRSRQGFSHVANLGIKQSRTEIVVLINNDCWVERNFLPPLLEHFIDNKVFAVSCKIIDWDSTRLRDGGKVGLFRRGFFSCVKNYDINSYKSNQEYTSFYASGAAMAMHRKKFLELDGFDELFAPFYSEDTDLSYRAWKKGWKVLYEPRSIVYHRPGTTIKKTYGWFYIRMIAQKNRLLFVWKNLEDPLMLVEHFVQLVIRLSFWILSFQIWELAGFLMASSKWREILCYRRKSNSKEYLSDREVIRRANYFFYKNHNEITRIW